MAGGWLSDSEISQWVNKATLETRQRVVAFEAIKALREGGSLTEVTVEKTLDKLVNDTNVSFTKYTRDYMLRNIPEGIPRY